MIKNSRIWSIIPETGPHTLHCTLAKFGIAGYSSELLFLNLILVSFWKNMKYLLGHLEKRLDLGEIVIIFTKIIYIHKLGKNFIN